MSVSVIPLIYQGSTIDSLYCNEVAIDAHGAATSSILKQITSLDKGQLSRTIKQLKEKNFIQITAATRHQRSSSLELTVKGKEKYAPLYQQVIKQNGFILENLTNFECKLLFELIEKMKPHLDQRLAEE